LFASTSQVIRWEDCLRYDLQIVKQDVTFYLSILPETSWQLIPKR